MTEQGQPQLDDVVARIEEQVLGGGVVDSAAREYPLAGYGGVKGLGLVEDGQATAGGKAGAEPELVVDRPVTAEALTQFGELAHPGRVPRGQAVLGDVHGAAPDGNGVLVVQPVDSAEGGVDGVEPFHRRQGVVVEVFAVAAVFHPDDAGRVDHEKTGGVRGHRIDRDVGRPGRRAEAIAGNRLRHHDLFHRIEAGVVPEGLVRPVHAVEHAGVGIVFETHRKIIEKRAAGVRDGHVLVHEGPQVSGHQGTVDGEKAVAGQVDFEIDDPAGAGGMGQRHFLREGIQRNSIFPAIGGGRDIDHVGTSGGVLGDGDVAHRLEDEADVRVLRGEGGGRSEDEQRRGGGELHGGKDFPGKMHLRN